MSGKNAAFLFGSGISLASGAPGVVEISRSLLEDRWSRHTNGAYYQDSPSLQFGRVEAACAQDFLRLLKPEIEAHLLAREGRPCNYEDLYAAALQIHQDVTAEITSPLLARAVDAIRISSLPLQELLPSKEFTDPLAGLAHQATLLIQGVVAHCLAKAPVPVQLELVSTVAKATENLDIFTLNHDLLVEAELKSKKVPYVDGFDRKRGGLVQFSWSWREQEKGARLFKLHGSTNWYFVRFPDVDQFARIDADFEGCRDENGNPARPLDSTPMFLTGTTVKEQAYGLSLFGEFFRAFHDYLAKHKTLICCGYGWSDKGINHRVKQWLHDDRANRVILLHNDPKDDLANKLFWRSHWHEGVEAGKIVVVPKWLCQCNLQDLEPYFDPAQAGPSLWRWAIQTCGRVQNTYRSHFHN